MRVFFIRSDSKYILTYPRILYPPYNTCCLFGLKMSSHIAVEKWYRVLVDYLLLVKRVTFGIHVCILLELQQTRNGEYASKQLCLC